jgi:hypothetical protein
MKAYLKAVQKKLVLFNHVLGYNLAAKRSKWCNEHVTSLSCNKKPLYARLGIGSDRNEMLWRCYCGEALTPSTYSYSTASSPAYETKHDEILAIN